MNKPKPISLIPEEERKKLLDRIRSNLIDSNGCLVWKDKKLIKKGYAHVYASGYNWLLHRLHYLLLNGEIPDGYEIDHICKNRACANPSHLEAVPQLINWKRSDAPSVRYSKATHCKRGHEFNSENTYVKHHLDTNKVTRECLVCKKGNLKRWHENRARKMANEYQDEIERLKSENQKLKAELDEQCILNAMGGDRELKLINENQRLKEAAAVLVDASENISKSDISIGSNAVAYGPYSKIAASALKQYREIIVNDKK